jgi:tRNA(Ile)-lysidine synthase
MSRVRPLGEAISLVRPLLGVRRGELREYLACLGQAWREDATNATTDATRNWIRHDMLPATAERVNPSVVEALIRLGTLAGEMETVVGGIAEELLERALRPGPAGGIAFACEGLAGAARYLVREALRRAWREQGWPEQQMGLAEWETLAEMAQGDGRMVQQRDFPGGVRARREGAMLVLAR